MPHGQFTPADHSKGDANTVGGYRAVHDRPATFEGADGYAYSVEAMAEETGRHEAPWAGYLLFVRWARIGAASPQGHLESPYLFTGRSESEMLAATGAMRLSDARQALDRLVAEHHGGRPPMRRWWDAMNADDDS
jgi:hypothetical protein